MHLYETELKSKTNALPMDNTRSKKSQHNYQGDWKTFSTGDNIQISTVAADKVKPTKFRGT
jgi:hypothetical protein